MNSPQLTVTCHSNFSGEPIHVEFDRFDPPGDVTKAFSQFVQFNIGIGGGDGVIKVDRDTPGSAVITISDGYVLTDPIGFEFKPGGSYTQDHPNSPRDIEQYVHVSHIQTTEKEIVFTILKGSSTRKGNVTITFYVSFKKA